MSNFKNSAAVTRTKAPTFQINRRHFIYTTALAASALATGCVTRSVNYKSPNEKLDIASIGTNGKGASDIANSSGENIVALCDVDENNLNAAAKKYPKAKLYRDYRIMLADKFSFDAVTVSTPDHHHAVATMQAIQMGKHVYCQKPLTHTIWEARQVMLAARKHKVATQMGNQGHSGEGNRELCEMIWSGVIGQVREVHCWTDRSKGWWAQGQRRPAGSDPVPANLDWNLWLGAAPERPYLATWPDAPATGDKKKKRGLNIYHNFAWRGWWDFGCGALGDMGCHIMDGANWALKFGSPETVELVHSSEIVPEMAPQSSIVRYQFPQRGDLVPCTMTWYDSGQKPQRPAELEAKELGSNGSLFIGDKGKIICETYGEKPTLLPESLMKDFKKPAQIIARVPENNPHLDWIRACKGGPAACSNFDVSAPFTETVLLGNLAIRLGKKIEWDAKHMRVKNMPEADILIKKHYRQGWSV